MAIRAINFWNQKRAESGYTLADTAKYLGCKLSTVGSYFSGYALPDKATIKKLCEFFDVEYEAGLAGFKEGFNTWTEAHADTYEVSGNTHRLKATEGNKKSKEKKQGRFNMKKVGTTHKAPKADNSWKKILIDKNISYVELAKAIGCSTPRVRAYFSGCALPRPEAIKKICEYTGIDLGVGTYQFHRIFKDWGIAHADTHVEISGTYQRISTPAGQRKVKKLAQAKNTTAEVPAAEVPAAELPVYDIPTEAVTESKPAKAAPAVATPSIETYLRLLYAKIPCDQFNAIAKSESIDDLLEALYGNVDYAVYREAMNLR